MKSQPWIGKPVVDIVFILLPPFASLLFILLFPSLFRDTKDMSVGGWVALVLLVDVAHVYSTLYRTYLDPKALQQQRSLLWAPALGHSFYLFCGGRAGVLDERSAVLADTGLHRSLSFRATAIRLYADI